jgi:hypothetical protein
MLGETIFTIPLYPPFIKGDKGSNRMVHANGWNGFNGLGGRHECRPYVFRRGSIHRTRFSLKFN